MQDTVAMKTVFGILNEVMCVDNCRVQARRVNEKAMSELTSECPADIFSVGERVSSGPDEVGEFRAGVNT
jgi:hypothetical protein